MRASVGLLFLWVGCFVEAQIPAFPGAEGFGAYAKGGRGGDVYHVTNLNASGAGSFAYGVTTSVPAAGRTIVFDVSGYAHISGTVRITNNKITIAGQTAPGDGFGLKDGTFLVSGDDIVIRHMRFRDGNSADSINLDSNSANSIFDHCDAMFSNDENMSTFGSPPENLTFQWGFNAWGMETHSCGGLWDMSHTTCSHSLWAHNHTRNPKARPGILEWIDNVTFDWDIGFIMGDTQTNANYTSNVRGCYFICPPGNTQSKAFVKGTVGSNGRPNYTLYMDNTLTDNNGDGVLNGTDKGYSIVEGSSYTNGQLPAPVAGDFRYYQAASPLTGSTAGVVIDNPLLSYKKIVSNAGPLRPEYDPAKPLRDEVANLLVTELVNQTAHHVNAVSKTNLPNGGFGNLISTPAPVDSDQDGIPDYYETAVTTGSSVWSSTTDDHNTVVPNSGGFVSEPTFFPTNTAVGSATLDKYTHLEEYLHFLAIPHAVVAKNSSLDIDLSKFTRGFSNAPVFTGTNVVNGTIALSGSGGKMVHFVPTTNAVGRAKFNFTVTDADGSSWTQQFGILISTNALPRNLTWQGPTNTWDTSSQNWLIGTSTTSYVDPDNVTLDDTGTNTNISIASSVAPSAININATKNYAFSGAAIGGITAVRKFGTGSLTIANPNSYSGGTVIDGSTLQVNDGGGIGSGVLILQNGATYTNNYSSGNTAGIGALIIPAGSSATVNSGNRLVISGALTGAGALTYNVQTTVTRFDLKGYSGAFTGPVSFTGSGNVRIYLSSGFGGFDATSVDVGPNVSLLPQTNSGGNGFAFGSLSGGNPASVLGGATSTGALNYSIGALNLSSTFASSIQGNATLTKVGTGTLTLTGACTYTGTTSINTGALVVNGSLGTTPVAVASGATLSGTGSFGGTVSVASGGKLIPGNSGTTGAINPTALTLVAGSTVPFDLSSNPASGNDKITLNGGALTATGSPSLLFNLTDGLLGSGTYSIISGGSTSTSTLNPTFTTNLPTGSRQGMALNTSTRGTVNLVVTGTAAALTWLGSPTNIWDSNSTVSWTGAPDPNNKFLPFDAVTFNDSGATGNVTINGGVRPRSLTVNNSALSYTFSGGSIGGSGMLIKNGPGTLTLFGSPLFLISTTTVGTTVNVDTTNLAIGMTVGGAGIPGGTTIASITNSTTLILSQAATAAATVTLAYYGNTYSGGTYLNGGTLVLGDDSANTFGLGTGPVTFGNGTTLTMHSDFSSYNTYTPNFIVPSGVTATLNTDSRSDLYGTLSGGGTFNYVVTANRTNLFSDWSAFTGTVNVTGGGDFRYGTSYGYAGFPQAAIALGNSVSMYYIGTLSGGAGTTITIGEISGVATAFVAGGATGGRALTLRVGSRNTDATFAGSIGEQGGSASGNSTSYVKTGVGTWTLSGSCYWNGNTTVEQGTLRILGSLTSPHAIDVQSGAGLSLQGGAITVDAVNIAAGATLSGNGTLNADLNNDGNVACNNGTITVTGDVVNNGTMRFTTGSGIIATGTFVNNGVLDLLTGAQSLPANLAPSSTGVIIDSSAVKVASASLSGNAFTVQIKGYTGHNYKLQRRNSLASGSWTDIGATQAGDSSAAQPLAFTDPAASGNQSFYRVSVSP